MSKRVKAGARPLSALSENPGPPVREDAVPSQSRLGPWPRLRRILCRAIACDTFHLCVVTCVVAFVRQCVAALQRSRAGARRVWRAPAREPRQKELPDDLG